MNLTPSNIVSFIEKLDRRQQYSYIAKRTQTVVMLVETTKPEGPIHIKRFQPNKQGTPKSAKIETISPEMLWRVCNAIQPNKPFNIDRILGASYNTRSALEALLAHTPQFHYCYPGRIEIINGKESVKRGHKHLMWCPDSPHRQGITNRIETDIIISEVPQAEVYYESINVSTPTTQKIDIDNARRHAQIQIALYLIGSHLGYRTWIAQNDKGIEFRKKRLCEHDGVISDLKNERLLSAFTDAASAALLIDCIWFKNGKLMPAVMEVEHTTGVRSGLLRMQKFKDLLPPFLSRWVIVAPDSDRDMVLRECAAPQFAGLNAKFFSYSAVEELYSLCSRRKVRGVTEEFLDCFMESTTQLPT